MDFIIDLEEACSKGNYDEVTEVKVEGEANHPFASLVYSLSLPYVVSVKDLKNVRLVCREWRDITLEQWRESAVLRLLWSPSSNSFCHGCNQVRKQVDYSRKSLTLSNYLKLLQKSEEGENPSSHPYRLSVTPFSRYRIGHCQLFQLGWGNGEASLNTFWSVCGPHVKFLFLDHCFIPDTRYGLGFRQILSNKCRKLEELWVHLVPTEMGMEQGRFLRQLDDSGHNEGLSPVLSLESMSLSICNKKRQKSGRLSHQFQPRQFQWRVLLQLAPNLKELTVSSKCSPVIQSLAHPSITGQFIRLSRLVYSTHKYLTFHSGIPGLAQYVEVARPPLQFVEITMEEPKWNLSCIRETVLRFLWHLRGLTCGFIVICLILGIFFLFLWPSKVKHKHTFLD